MRSLTLTLATLVIWLAAPGCLFVHDTDCADDRDCENGRVCDAGSCVARSGSGSGVAPGAVEGDPEGSGEPSSTPSNAPSCTDLSSGTQQGSAPDSVICNPEVTSVSVTIGTGGKVQSIDGRSCTLLSPGTKCYSTFPDTYQCGDCEFHAQAESIDGTTPVGWSVGAESCSEPGCAEYCCASESGILFAADYWLDQTAPGGSSGGGSTPGGGGNPRDPCAGCGFPFCDGNCAGCC